MNDGTRVEWRAWGREAFAEAVDRDVPILLSLTATWCDSCHEMDAETYAVPTVAANVNDDFVPVRVDVDRHPRVRDRYNMGGFPSTVFLAPDGAVLTGAGYLGQDGLRQVLERVRALWETKGAEAGRVPRPLQDETPPAGELTEDVEAGMLGQLTAAYDEVAGGWGDGPKFPLPEALEFALKRDREMARRSLDAVSANLLDEYEGGFYRYALESDWSEIQHEKLLDENAALVRAFAHAYCYTGREAYREPADRTIGYLTTTLWNGDAGAFAGSQAPAPAASYTLEPSDREGDEPPVDDTVYAGANALAVDALLAYYGYTDDERARRYAERALEHLRTALLEDGAVTHFRTADATGEPCLLANQARVLEALTSARSVLGADVLEEAEAVAEVTLERLRDGDSFLDGPATGCGLCSRPLRPLGANVELADALVDLAVLTGEQRYRAVAGETLADFAGASDRFGPSAARYASVAARLLEEPLVVRVADEAGSDLHRAALRVADHESVVVPDAGGVEPGTARVERGERVSDAAETPAELGDRLRSVLE